MSVDRLRRGVRDASESTASGLSAPRVVIFESDGAPHVEVVELPGDAEIGTHFCHLGTSWMVTDFRTHNRVIICRQAEA